MTTDGRGVHPQQPKNFSSLKFLKKNSKKDLLRVSGELLRVGWYLLRVKWDLAKVNTDISRLGQYLV